MKRMIKAALGAAPLVVLAHLASAGEPVQLSHQQMDAVTAAGSAAALAEAVTVGGVAFAQTLVLAQVEVVNQQQFQTSTISTVQSTSVAESFSDTVGP